MSQAETLSILIPAYNEAANIGTLLEKVAAVDLPYGVREQIIVVDDGSSDSTLAIAQDFARRHTERPVMVMAHDHNRGKGAAIRTALAHAEGRYVIIQDADLELDPSDIAVLLRYMIDENLPVVYGSRFLGVGNTHTYRSYYMGGRIVSWVANVLYGQHITDEPTCYKLFRREVLSRIDLKCTGFEFCPEVTAKVSKLGIKIKEVPIHYKPRTLEEGKKLHWSDGVEAVWTLLKYRFVD